MQWIWLFPSVGYGVYTFITSGQPTGLIFGAFSLFAVLSATFLAGRKEPVDLKAPVRFNLQEGSRWRVAIGNRVLPRYEWLWQPAWVGRVYQELESQNDLRNAGAKLSSRVGGSLVAQGPGLTAWLGFAGSAEVTVDLAGDGAHALILGATGSGKSQLLTCWLVSLAQRFKPDQLNYWLIDFKGGATFGSLRDANWVKRYSTDLDGEVLRLLSDLLNELRERELSCAVAGVGRIEDLPQNLRPPYLVAAIDEAQQLLTDPQTHAALIAVAARGRSLGVHLVMTSQSLSGIPRLLMANLGIRVAVGKPDPVDLAQLGFQRTASPTDAHSGGAPAPEPANPGGWGRAVLISQSQQVSFAFPSQGKVGFERLFHPDESEAKNVLVAASAPFEHQIAQIPTDSVVIPRNTFDFSIGIEKQL